MTLGEPNNCVCGRTVTGSASCPEHPKEPVFFDPIPIKTLPEDVIPEGPYCYKHTGRVKIHNKVIDHDGVSMRVPYYFVPEMENCPFWRRTDDMGAHCDWTGESSEYQDINNLMWDQVKECGLKTQDDEYTLFELEELRLNPLTPLDHAMKYARKTPDFIQSLVNILLDSEVNEFKYDGVVYTLSHTIVNGS